MGLGNAWLGGPFLFPPIGVIIPDFIDDSVVYSPTVVSGTSTIVPTFIDDSIVYLPTLLADVLIIPEFIDDSVVYPPVVTTEAVLNRFFVRRGPLVKDWGDWTPATKQDVHVYVNSVEVEVRDVNPYDGEITLVSPVFPTDDVRVDYKWIRHPIMGMLLNTRGLGLNKSDHRNGLGQFYGPGGTITGHGDQIQAPGFPKGALRTRSRFMFRTVIQGPPAPYARPKPLLIGHRYIGFEKAYSAVLNSPTSMRLNNSPNRIAKLGFKRSVKGVSEFFEGVLTPQASQTPWALEGYDAGQVDINEGTYTVVDSRAGSFDPENPSVSLYWREVDLTYPASSYIVGRFQIEDAASLLKSSNTDILSTNGVFTGVGFGIHNNLRIWLAGALLVNGLEHVGLLLDSRRPEKVTSWKVGPASTATIKTKTSMSVLTGQIPLELSDGHRFQILTGTQVGIYTATHVVHQSDSTTTCTVSPAFPADFTKYGNQYPEVVWESLWSEHPSTYRLEVAPERNLAVLKVSGATTGTVVYMNDVAPLLAEGALVGQTAVSNLLAGMSIGTGPGKVEYLAVPHGQAGNGIVVSQVYPASAQAVTTVSVVGTNITVNLARAADVLGTKAAVDVGVGDSGFHVQAYPEGAAGNLIQIQAIDPGAPSSPLSISVLGQVITVNLETNAGSVLVSTPNDVVTALITYSISALPGQPVVDAVSLGTGLGIVVASGLLNLSGGTDLVPGAITATGADVANAIAATPAAATQVDASSPTYGIAQLGTRMLSGGKGITTEGSGQAFWGSLDAKATSRSKWSFFRYGIVPDYSTLRSSSQTVAAEMVGLPEDEAYNPWFVTQQFGYAEAGSPLLLKSTSNHPTLNFSFGYDRVEPFLLPYAYLDVQAKLLVDSGTVGSGDAQILLRDTQREVRVSTLLYFESGTGINYRRLIDLPSVSYAGLLNPAKLEWISVAAPTATAENIGPVLNILQASTQSGVYQKEIDLSGLTYTPSAGRIIEARLAVLDYAGAGVTGIQFNADVEGRFIGVRLNAAGPTVELIDATLTAVQSYPFTWTDALPHTYRVVADADGGTVTFYIDDTLQLPTKNMTDFVVGAGSTLCEFGIAASGVGVTSETEWYSVSCQALPPMGAKRTIGVWLGGDPDSINSWELPRTDSSTAPNSMQLGPVIEEMDWRSALELRVFRSPTWGVTVYRPDMPLPPFYTPEVAGVPGTGFATQTTEPSAGWINVETVKLPRVSSVFGSVAFGALDPMALTQQRWSWMRYRLYRPPTASHLAPQGMVLNRSNVVTSGELNRDITLEVVTVKPSSPTTLNLMDVHQRAGDVYKVLDGTTSYVRDSWSFDTKSQALTLNEGLSFVSPTVTVTFNPGRPVTTTYLKNQPVLDGVTQLNEDTPPVPKGQTVEASRAEQVRDFPTVIPDRVTLAAYSPNNPKGIPDSTAYQAADTNMFADFMSATAAQYEKMTFIEVPDEGEKGLIATISDSELPQDGFFPGLPGGPEIFVEGFVIPFMDFSEVYIPTIPGPVVIEPDFIDDSVVYTPRVVSPIVATILGEADVVGALTADTPLSAMVLGEADVVGALINYWLPLVGNVGGEAIISSVLTVLVPLLAGQADGTATVTGTFLDGNIRGETDGVGTFVIGDVLGEATVTGTLT